MSAAKKHVACLTCASVFTPRKSNERYCAGACRRKAQNSRAKARRSILSDFGTPTTQSILNRREAGAVKAGVLGVPKASFASEVLDAKTRVCRKAAGSERAVGIVVWLEGGWYARSAATCNAAQLFWGPSTSEGRAHAALESHLTHKVFADIGAEKRATRTAENTLDLSEWPRATTQAMAS
jgi:hypothetical protein